MFPLDIIQSKAVDKIESALEDLDHEVKFENPAGNQWQIVVSFDLDKSSLSETEKMLLGTILKYL